MSNIYFSARVNLLLDSRAINQKELAAAIGINKNTFNGYMTSYRDVPVETLVKVADYFDVSTDYLLGRTDDPTR